MYPATPTTCPGYASTGQYPLLAVLVIYHDIYKYRISLRCEANYLRENEAGTNSYLVDIDVVEQDLGQLRRVVTYEASRP